MQKLGLPSNWENIWCWLHCKEFCSLIICTPWIGFLESTRRSSFWSKASWGLLKDFAQNWRLSLTLDYQKKRMSTFSWNSPRGWSSLLNWKSKSREFLVNLSSQLKRVLTCICWFFAMIHLFPIVKITSNGVTEIVFHMLTFRIKDDFPLVCILSDLSFSSCPPFLDNIPGFSISLEHYFPN